MARFRSGFFACFSLSLVLTLLLGFGVLARGRTFTPTDFLTSRFPWNGLYTSDVSLKNRNAQDILEFDATQAIGAAESLRRGELFLWNPRIFCGWAAVGDPQLGTFYLPRLLLLRLLPPLLALDLLILLHYFGAGLAMYALAREWGLRESGAVVSSLVWLLCGPQVVWFRYAGGLPAAVYFPLMAFALHRGLAQRRLDWVAGAGALWALLFLSAHPQLSFLALLWTAACLAVHLHRGDSRWTLRAAALFGVAGAGLAGVQLFPFLESMGESQKAAFTEGVGFSRPLRVPLLLVTLIWQRAFGSPIDRVDLTPELTGDNFFNLQGYMGLLPLLLALLAWKRGRFLWIIALVCLVLATCYPLWWLILKVLPFLRVFDPHRLYLFAFVTALLSGLGLEELLDRPPGQRLRIACALASAGFILVGLAGALRSATWLSLQNPAYVALVAASLLTTGAIWISSWAVSPIVKTAFVCAAILGDLLPGMLAYNPTYEPLPPEPAELATLSREDRVQIDLPTPHYDIEFGNLATIYGCSTAEGYGSQYPELYGQLVRVLEGTVEERRIRLVHHADRTLYVLNVTAVLDKNGVHRLEALPRAWLVGKAEFIPNPVKRMVHMANYLFDFRKSAVLEEEIPPMGGDPQGEVSRSGPNEYRVRSDRACLLVISETYHPGWQAMVDGHETRILRADHAFRAIPLAAGEHQVVLAFRPGSVRLGLACTAATALGLGILAGASRLSKRRIRGGIPS